ncbi:MAG: hypothetical protein Q9186_004992 [Xanthomendoza sp. 1 TL-2023]
MFTDYSEQGNDLLDQCIDRDLPPQSQPPGIPRPGEFEVGHDLNPPPLDPPIDLTQIDLIIEQLQTSETEPVDDHNAVAEDPNQLELPSSELEPTVSHDLIPFPANRQHANTYPPLDLGPVDLKSSADVPPALIRFYHPPVWSLVSTSPLESPTTNTFKTPLPDSAYYSNLTSPNFRYQDSPLLNDSPRHTVHDDDALELPRNRPVTEAQMFPNLSTFGTPQVPIATPTPKKPRVTKSKYSSQKQSSRAPHALAPAASGVRKPRDSLKGLTQEEVRRRKKEKNTEAAQRCRARRVANHKHLEDEIAELTTRVEGLNYMIETWRTRAFEHEALARDWRDRAITMGWSGENE